MYTGEEFRLSTSWICNQMIGWINKSHDLKMAAPRPGELSTMNCAVNGNEAHSLANRLIGKEVYVLKLLLIG